jgi:hypothetical protein
MMAYYVLIFFYHQTFNKCIVYLMHCNRLKEIVVIISYCYYHQQSQQREIVRGEKIPKYSTLIWVNLLQYLLLDRATAIIIFLFTV